MITIREKPLFLFTVVLFLLGTLFITNVQGDCTLDMRVHIVPPTKVNAMCRDLFRIGKSTPPPVSVNIEWCKHKSGVLIVPENLDPNALYPGLISLIKQQCPDHLLRMRMQQLDEQQKKQKALPKKNKRKRRSNRPQKAHLNVEEVH